MKWFQEERSAAAERCRTIYKLLVQPEKLVNRISGDGRRAEEFIRDTNWPPEVLASWEQIRYHSFHFKTCSNSIWVVQNNPRGPPVNPVNERGSVAISRTWSLQINLYIKWKFNPIDKQVQTSVFRLIPRGSSACSRGCWMKFATMKINLYNKTLKSVERSVFVRLYPFPANFHQLTFGHCTSKISCEMQGLRVKARTSLAICSEDFRQRTHWSTRIKVLEISCL